MARNRKSALIDLTISSDDDDVRTLSPPRNYFQSRGFNTSNGNSIKQQNATAAKLPPSAQKIPKGLTPGTKKAAAIPQAKGQEQPSAPTPQGSRRVGQSVTEARTGHVKQLLIQPASLRVSNGHEQRGTQKARLSDAARASVGSDIQNNDSHVDRKPNFRMPRGLGQQSEPAASDNRVEPVSNHHNGEDRQTNFKRPRESEAADDSGIVSKKQKFEINEQPSAPKASGAQQQAEVRDDESTINNGQTELSAPRRRKKLRHHHKQVLDSSRSPNVGRGSDTESVQTELEARIAPFMSKQTSHQVKRGQQSETPDLLNGTLETVPKLSSGKPSESLHHLPIEDFGDADQKPSQPDRSGTKMRNSTIIKSRPTTDLVARKSMPSDQNAIDLCSDASSDKCTKNTGDKVKVAYKYREPHGSSGRSVASSSKTTNQLDRSLSVLSKKRSPLPTQLQSHDHSQDSDKHFSREEISGQASTSQCPEKSPRPEKPFPSTAPVSRVSNTLAESELSTAAFRTPSFPFKERDDQGGTLDRLKFRESHPHRELGKEQHAVDKELPGIPDTGLINPPHDNCQKTKRDTPSSSAKVMHELDSAIGLPSPRADTSSEGRTTQRSSVQPDGGEASEFVNAVRSHAIPTAHGQLSTGKQALQQLPPLRHTKKTTPTASAEIAPSDIHKTPLMEASPDIDRLLTPPANPIVSEAASLCPNMSVSRQIEQNLEKRCAELREDNELWISTWLQWSREKPGVARESPTNQPTSVFKHMKPLHFDTVATKRADSEKPLVKVTVESFGEKVAKTSWLLSCQALGTHETKDVPDYSHYVTIRDNILAPNETILQHWPYFGDDFDITKAYNLKNEYFLDVELRQRKLDRLLQAELYADYVEDLLGQIGGEWSDVLRFFLDPLPEVGQDTDAIKALLLRDQLCKEDFDRTKERWITVLSKLPLASPTNMAKAALLSLHFNQKAKFSLWHLARRSDYVLHELDEIEQDSLVEDEITCRTCLRFDCPFHGEIDDLEIGDQECRPNPGANQGDVVETDIIQPPKVNFRCRVTFPSATRDSGAKGPKRSLQYWQSFDFLPDDRGPFYPCDHPGVECVDAKCSCFENKLPCEKTCGCSSSCSRKFQGCSCISQKDKSKRGGRSVCFDDEKCLCFQLGRECDPDLCGDCGVRDVLNPIDRHDDHTLFGRCRNASIQRGVPKHTILGESGVHGLGLYACQEIYENEFVGEYKGEIIKREEGERRGAVYEHQNLSYLFSLNAQQEIDSTYFGNKMRFINHAGKSKSNLYPRIIMVNTIHRIALYANRRIHSGDELFFDYGPKFPGEQLGGKKSKAKEDSTAKKAIPHVRNANITKGFYDLEEKEDELGHTRLRKSQTGSKRARASPDRRLSLGKEASPSKSARSKQNGRSPEKRAGEQAVPNESDEGEAIEDPRERLQTYYVSTEASSDPMDVDIENVDAEEDEDDDFDPDSNNDNDDSVNSAEIGDSDEEGSAEELRNRGRGRPRKVGS